MMTVNIKKLNDKAVVPYKSHDDDFCFDLVATSCEEIAPNIYKYGTGIALQVAERFKSFARKNSAIVGFDVRPRSSIWKTGMVLSNGVGTIDEGYAGEICAVFYHVMPTMPKYEVGDRICQLCAAQTASEIKFVEVEELGETERGTGGYGSTGK